MIKINDPLANLISPLDAFYQRVQQSPDSLCFVQPLGEGRVEQYTWSRASDEVRSMAAYLLSLELPPGSHIALFSKNCAQWIMADLAIWLAGHVTIPIYPTLSAESIRQIMQHSGSQLVFIGKLDNWEEMQDGIAENIPRVCFSSSPDAVKAECLCWDKVLTEFTPFAQSPSPDLDALATIVYTSGTTGMPKGVMHSFRTMGTTGLLAGELYQSGGADRFLSYLPLAHAAERASVEVCQFYRGFAIYFCHSLDTFAEDLLRASPTLFFAVPRIWTKLQQGVFAKLSPRVLNTLMMVPGVSGLLGRKILGKMGLGNVRIAISGAAPLSTSLLAWYRKLGLEILEGYGMSENFAYSHTSQLGESKMGYVGTANPYVDCRIADSGEILIHSPTNMLGYYKDPEQTRATLDEKGYLHTGDIGTIDQRGRLKITGRIKEIFKTSKGKYVTPAPIENRLLSNTNVEQVCVTGASLPQPIALVNLSAVAMKKLDSSEDGKQEIINSFSDLLNELNGIVDKHENLQCLVIVREIWGVENNFTTPTLKIRRNTIDEYYGKFYQSWVDSGNKVIVV
ncbi:AMP-binding protein [Oceanicoccus sp. KOV_DT_Chl]|uniref:AMP-binding protein n=1 Tax=Oceanicoccus sp. KOV_DT_Chl TaxID=1904639 RepID=UPI001F252211|nr:AMP-binding protein [Oceanicoccus sp. KOV_DT_Chl]